MSASDTPSAGDLPEEPTGTPDLMARVVTHEDAPDECTIAPYDAVGVELLTHWITAKEGSYVPLTEMR